ncbi:mucin-binding protein [Lacticaseibacillus mingshuiensis]|uniref:mucin-binding protein n=1 Tax=Lacticaseibacillus mingshuiensis TaxID=2799574 RepID=UPI0019425636|nr:KxYKxGKxW signal peptide domain-containing protein [Lacticaseibacillus mingshuiensis]
MSNGDRKVHFKMYKAGRKWLVAGIALFGIGTAGVYVGTQSAAPVTAAAAATDVSEPDTSLTTDLNTSNTVMPGEPEKNLKSFVDEAGTAINVNYDNFYANFLSNTADSKVDVSRVGDSTSAQILVTPDTPNQSGNVTLKNKIDLSHDFELVGHVVVTNTTGANDADGLAFGFHTGNSTAVGADGGSLGLSSSDKTNGSLPDVFGWKLDTFSNGPVSSDKVKDMHSGVANYTADKFDGTEEGQTSFVTSSNGGTLTTLNGVATHRKAESPVDARKNNGRNVGEHAVNISKPTRNSSNTIKFNLSIDASYHYDATNNSGVFSVEVTDKINGQSWTQEMPVPADFFNDDGTTKPVSFIISGSTGQEHDKQVFVLDRFTYAPVGVTQVVFHDVDNSTADKTLELPGQLGKTATMEESKEYADLYNEYIGKEYKVVSVEGDGDTNEDGTQVTFGSGQKVTINLQKAVSQDFVFWDDEGGKQVDTTTTVKGDPDDTVNWTAMLPSEKYVFADGQETTGTLKLNKGSEPVTIHLKHKHTADTFKTTDKVTYTGAGDKTPADVATPVEWTHDTDLVTGIQTWAPIGSNLDSIDSPVIDGYTADQKTVSFENPTATTVEPTDQTKTVTYTADQATLTIHYTGLPADKTPADQVITGTTDAPVGDYTVPMFPGYTADTSKVPTNFPAGNTTVEVPYTAQDVALKVSYFDTALQQQLSEKTISGKTDQQGDYIVTLPSGYVLAEGQAKLISYVLTADDSDDFTVNLTHKISEGTTTTTRTINYVIENGDKSKTPESVKQTVTYNTVTDEVTGKPFATPQGQYDKVTSPDLAGYTADVAEVPSKQPQAGAVDDLNANEVVTVTYTPVESLLKVTYIDDATGKELKDLRTTLSGPTDSTDTYPVKSDLPTGYKLAKKQESTVDYKFEADDSDDITIHLNHVLTEGTTDTTRTINYVIENGDKSKTPNSVTQTVKYNTVTDEVTGETFATPQGQYDELISPTLDGYQVDKPEVASEQPQAVNSDDLKDETITVTYTPVEESLEVTYFDDATKKQVGGVVKTISGLTDSTGTYTVDSKLPAGYKLAAGQRSTVNYTITADDSDHITIHLNHVLANPNSAGLEGSSFFEM